MKLILTNAFILVLFNFFNISYAADFNAEYTVNTSGIKIGKFSWSININENKYETNINLKNSGFFSPLYKFKGEYYSAGIVESGTFKSKKYKQYWKTKNKTKVIKLSFGEYLESIVQEPKEKEVSRFDLYKLFQHTDPITSFINILSGNSVSKTIDGRRVYTMRKVGSKNSNIVSIKIMNYRNIWADHKRNDLEKIELYLDQDMFLPKRINVYFKGKVFALKKT